MALINYPISNVTDTGDEQDFNCQIGAETISFPYDLFADMNNQDPTANGLVWTQVFLAMMDAGTDMTSWATIRTFLEGFVVRIPEGIL